MQKIKAEGTATEETSVQEELTDTRVVDIFAELNEEPVSEDAENDFEEKMRVFIKQMEVY